MPIADWYQASAAMSSLLVTRLTASAGVTSPFGSAGALIAGTVLLLLGTAACCMWRRRGRSHAFSSPIAAAMDEDYRIRLRNRYAQNLAQAEQAGLLRVAIGGSSDNEE